MLKSGHKVIPVSGKEQDKQVKDFKTHFVGTVRLEPDGWFFTLPFIEFADKLFEFKFRCSDLLVMTYPKSGTTWTQEILWTMRNNPDLNNPLGDLPVNFRAPFLDADYVFRVMNQPIVSGDELYDYFYSQCPDKNIEDGLFLQLLDTIPDPRIIKTHLPFSLLMPNLLDTCKVIYVLRDPKDVVVSYNHHLKFMKVHGFVGSMDDMVDHFLNGTLLWSPFWKHVEEAWKQRSHSNIHFIFYEDMKKDPRAEIVRLQKFIGTKLTDKQIDNVVQHTSFAEMKKRDNAMGEKNIAKVEDCRFLDMKIVKEEGGALFRKGQIGDWKNKLTPAQATKIDEWTKKNTSSFGSDFKYGK